MAAWSELIEHGIPDRIDTADHPAPLAAELDFLAGRFDAEADGSADMPATLVARSAVLAGRGDRAREMLAGVDVASLNLHETVAMAWSVARVGPVDAIPTLLARFAATDEFLCEGALPLGPRATIVGQLLAASGDLDRAAAELDRGITVGDARAPIWGALARVELARILLCRAATDPDQPASRVGPLLTSARTLFRAGGYRALLERCDGLTRPDLSPGSPLVGELSYDGAWVAGFGAMPTVGVRASRGLGALRHLIECAPRPVPAVELDRVVRGEDHSRIAALAAGGSSAGLASDPGTLDDDAMAHELRNLLFDDAVRSRISKLIRRTITRLDHAHPVLGAHLRHTIHTGHVCHYEPIGAHRVLWRFEAGR